VSVMPDQPIPNGAKYRYKHRDDQTAFSFGDLVVMVVRARPKLRVMSKVEAKDGYRTWARWTDLYELKGTAQ